MADREVSLKFRVSDDGTLKVFDEAERKLRQVERSADDFSQTSVAGFGRVSGAMAGIVTAAGAVVAAIGGIRLAVEGVRVAAEFEQLRTRLVSLSGSVDEATDRFERFRNIAATTPFTVRGVVEAGIALEAFGAQADATLKPVADLAAFMGTDVVDAAQAVGRAWSAGAGAADVLRERGVLALVQMRAGVDDLTKLSLPEFREALFEAMVDPAGKIAGATDRLSQTWTGALSNLTDSTDTFKASLGDVIIQSEAVRSVVSELESLFRSGAVAVNAWRRENQEFIDNTVLEYWREFRDVVGQTVDALQAVNLLPETHAGKLERQIAALRDTNEIARQNLQRGNGFLGGLFPIDNEQVEREIRKREGQIARLEEKLDLVRRFNERVSSPTFAGSEVAPVDFAAGIVESTEAAGRSSEKATQEVEQLTDAYGRLGTRSADVANDLRQITTELDRQTETISIDFGDAFRRLTTGGGDFDFLDGFKNATQAAAADAFDAILGEKLSFDLQIERNFAEDLPSFFQSGLDAIKSLWSDGTADLVSTSQSASGQIGRAFGGSFDGIAASGQALAQQLAGLGVPTVGGTQVPLSPPFGNLAGGRVGTAGGQFVAVDAFGTQFAGSDLSSVLGAASGQSGLAGAQGSALGGAAGGLILTAVVASINGAIAAFDEAKQIDRELGQSLDRISQREESSRVVGAALEGFFGTVGLGSIGKLLGESIGSIKGVDQNTAFFDNTVGAIFAPGLGLVLEGLGLDVPDFGLAPKRSRGDEVAKFLQDSIFKKNPLLLQQGAFRDSGRTGIDSDLLFETTARRLPLFTQFGVAGPDYVLDQVLDRPGRGLPEERRLLELLSNTNPELEKALFSPALGAASLLGRGNDEDTRILTNILLSNQLLSGQEFEEEGRRQLRNTVQSAGFDLFSGLETLASDFSRAQQQFEVGGSASELTRDDFIQRAATVIDLLGEDLPKGVDVLSIVEKHTGRTSVNTGVMFEEIQRQTEIFGNLAAGLDSSLKSGLGAALLQPTGASVLAGGGRLQDVVRAVGREGSAFTSQLQTGIRDSVSIAITEGVFDAVEATPAWQALTGQIADAIKDPSLFATLPQLIGDVYSASVPIINAAQAGSRAFFDAFAVTPETLFGQADAFRGRAEDLRFGRLTAEGQVASIDKQIAKAERDLIRGYQTGDINLLTGALTTLGTLGEQRAGLADALIPGGGVANERRRESFFNESLKYVDFAAKGLERAGQFQQDAITGNTDAQKENTAAAGTLTEATTSLTDEIITLQDVIRAVGTGNIPTATIAQAVARIIVSDPIARNEIEAVARSSR